MKKTIAQKIFLKKFEKNIIIEKDLSVMQERIIEVKIKKCIEKGHTHKGKLLSIFIIIHFSHMKEEYGEADILEFFQIHKILARKNQSVGFFDTKRNIFRKNKSNFIIH
jgi:hypothetical protein